MQGAVSPAAELEGGDVTTDEGRMVALEVRQQHLQTEVESLCKRLDTLADELSANNLLLAKHKGMLAGAVMLINLIWIAAVALWQTKE